MRIRADGQTYARSKLDHAGIVAGAQCRIVERRQKHMLDQLVRQPSTAAVSHDDPISMGEGERANCSFADGELALFFDQLISNHLSLLLMGV